MSRPVPPESAHSERAVIAFLAFLGILLAFGIDVALPAFDEISTSFDLDSSGSGISLVGTTYILGMALGQIVYGPISDRFGRRPILLIGLGLYVVGGIAAALAPSFTLLLAARVVWGLGAAAPSVLRSAIARDLFSGNEMARVVTLMMAVFMIGPMAVPFFGQAILSFADWPWVFGAASMMAVAAIVWTIRFGETLPEDNRRELSLTPLTEAAKAVMRTRVTIGHIAVQTLSGAAFFIFLGSSAPIIDNIYDEADRFPIWFGLSGITAVFGLLVNNQLLRRFGTPNMIRAVSILQVTLSTIGLGLALATDGRPAFSLWLGVVCLINACSTLSTPMANALALEPMGEQAGMASAILGLVSLAGGSLLAAIFDARIEDTVTPMHVGFLLYGGLALIGVLWSRGHSERVRR